MDLHCLMEENQDLIIGGNKKRGAKKGSAKSGGQTPQGGSLTTIIVFVVVLAVVGVLFGYMKDKFSRVSQESVSKANSLESQVELLKQELADLKQKASVLEKDNLASKQVVIDLFDKERTLPRNPDVSAWQTLNNSDLSFNISYPATWEAVNPVVETKKTSNQKDYKEETVVLQPKAQTDFINAVTVKTDYQDFASLPLKDKKQIFEDLPILDRYDFDSGEMIYFINIDKNNEEVPTVLILTKSNIYRATFNVTNKQLTNYFEYREDFEKMIVTFGLNTPVKK